MKSYETFRIALQAHLECEVVSEYHFARERGLQRRWRADFAVPQKNVLIEIEGGVWTNGRHTRAKGYAADIEKYNAAALLGYKVYRVLPSDLLKIRTFNDIKKLCEQNE